MIDRSIDFCNECHRRCNNGCVRFRRIPFATPTILVDEQFIVLCFDCDEAYRPKEI